jgi:hypothetical protein
MALPQKHLDALTEILRRQAPDSEICTEDLGNEIEALLNATGIAISKDDGFDEFQKWANAAPSQRELATYLYKIADAKNPLSVYEQFPDDEEHRRAIVLRDAALIALNFRIRKKWASQSFDGPQPLFGIEWGALTPWQQDSIRQESLALAAETEHRIPQGAPQNTTYDALLLGLADIFLSFTEQTNDRYDLPDSTGSIFIKFVGAVLAPYDQQNFTAKALSNRWRRLKQRVRSEGAPITPHQPKIRRRPTH